MRLVGGYGARMSPVSRKRKRKSGGSPSPQKPYAAPSGSLAPLRALGFQQPEWWSASWERVLGDLSALEAADGPAALEAASIEAVGSVAYDAFLTEEDGHDWESWVVGLVSAAEPRAAESGVHRLLRTLEGTTTGDGYRLIRKVLGKTRHSAKAAGEVPDWLRHSAAQPTGETAMLRDLYGSRAAVLLECAYPEPGPSGKKARLAAGRHVLLFDVDMCSHHEVVVDFGVFPDESAAADHWRAVVGPAAAESTAGPVARELIAALVRDAETPLDFWVGDEGRSVVANYGRVRRRLVDLGTVLAKRGVDLRPVAGRYETPEAEALTDDFMRWRAASGADPVSTTEAVGVLWLVGDWCEGPLPMCRLTASPHRVACALNTLGDWKPGPETNAARKLLPDWVRYVLEQSGVSGEFAAASVRIAEGEPYPHLGPEGDVPLAGAVVE